VCQESEVGKEAGVGWEVYVGMAGVASQEGAEKWVQFGEAVALKMGVSLFQVQVWFHVFGRVWDVWFAQECIHYAGQQVNNCSC